MRIRKFKDADAVELARLHREIIRSVNSNDYTRAQIKAWSNTSAKKFRDKAKSQEVLVALDSGNIVGWAAYYKSEITGLYVDKSYLGQGIGKRLLMKIEELAIKSGDKYLKALSTITAKGFYASQGFKVIKQTHHVIGEQKLEVIEMKKKLV